jgi:hypothetical protein
VPRLFSLNDASVTAGLVGETLVFGEGGGGGIHRAPGIIESRRQGRARVFDEHLARAAVEDLGGGVDRGLCALNLEEGLGLRGLEAGELGVVLRLGLRAHALQHQHSGNDDRHEGDAEDAQNHREAGHCSAGSRRVGTVGGHGRLLRDVRRSTSLPEEGPEWRGRDKDSGQQSHTVRR